MERDSVFQFARVTEDSAAFAVLTKAMREADELHQTEGGGTRHYLRECFLPALERHGLAVVEAPNAVTPRNSWELNRWERAWWHLRCGRVRLAWTVLRG